MLFQPCGFYFFNSLIVDILGNQAAWFWFCGHLRLEVNENSTQQVA